MTRIDRLRLIAGLAVACALPVSASFAWQPAGATTPPAAGAQPGGKIPVKSADDLPRHTYKIDGKATEFIQSGAPFYAFLIRVKGDVEGDLAKYDITDKSTRQQYLGLLQQIAIVEGRYDDAAKLIEQIKELEGKESKRLMMGHVLAAMQAAKAAGGGADNPKALEAFKSTLNSRVSALPWEKVREEVLQTKGRAEIMSKEMVIGGLQGALDPVVEKQKGEISNDVAWPMVNAGAAIMVMLPWQPAVAEVYGKIADERAKAQAPAKDIWTPTQVTLTAADKGTPVVAAIWDSGVDVSLFPGLLWVNESEKLNGRDDDNNGFIDDINGIAYDLKANPVPELLCSTKELHNDKALVTAHTKGFMDLQANVNSPEADAIKKFFAGLKADQVTPFQEDLGLFGNYSHGTHVAGITAAGNPYVRLLPARITFDWHAIPVDAPSFEQAARDAKAAKDTVDYFKHAGVRVVNMSWGGNRKEIEHALEQKGVGKDGAERAEMARKLFKIQRDALETAFKSAPEILFIAAAGNSNEDNEFGEFIPSGFTLPNLITIGAIDSSGKPTGFTTFGKNVKLYANGFEVESYIPGGQKMKFSGTSMAAPNATNLAAKLFALNPKLTVAQAIELMTKGADPLEGQPGRLIINPKKSIEMMKAGK